MVTDGGAVLVFAVIVTGNCASPDIGRLAYLGIAQVGQVIGLCSFAKTRFLQFNEVAYMGILFKDSPRTKPGKRPDQTVFADIRTLEMGERMDNSPCCDF